MRRIEFHFDFISPFSYIAQQRLGELPADVEIDYRPLLFAGLLDHWGGVGPAETPSQRQFTYRYCNWLARRLGIAYHSPPAHPFNPLPALRAALAMDAAPAAVAAIFEHIWARGRLPEGGHWDALLAGLGIDASAVNRPAIKQALRANTTAAIDAGVFGVPTFVVDGELFFGQDALPMLLDYLREPAGVIDDEYRRLGDLPSLASRRPQATPGATPEAGG